MSDPYLRIRLTKGDSELRASDADREEVAERLRTAHAEGRLDLAELQQRLGQCFAARTAGQLTALVRDLPRPADAGRGGPGWNTAVSRRLRAFAVLLIALLILSSAAGHHVFWIWIPLAFLAVRLYAARRARLPVAGRGGWDGWS
jgi:hypothetical protein